MTAANDGPVRPADVVVIGAGQAGLSAAYHLQRRGFVPAATGTEDRDPPGGPAKSYIVLDSEDGPGGAWRHRWKSLLMATVNGISDLPGIPQPSVDPDEASSSFLTRYFGGYEHQLALAIERPVKVRAVSREDHDPAGRLRITTSRGDWTARAVINATGTWTRPFWPIYPGQASFRGRQLHVADYVSAEEFRGRHVIVVGGGISAVGLLEEISHVTSTSWFTRREPVWRDAAFDRQAGHDAVALVEERVRQGLPPQSVVAVTGLIWTPVLRAAAARGVLERHPMFSAIEPGGVRLADGSFRNADVILWAPASGPNSSTSPRCACAAPAAGSRWTAPRSRRNRGSTWLAMVRPRPRSAPTGPAGPRWRPSCIFSGSRISWQGPATSRPEHPDSQKRRQLARGGQHP